MSDASPPPPAPEGAGLQGDPFADYDLNDDYSPDDQGTEDDVIEDVEGVPGASDAGASDEADLEDGLVWEDEGWAEVDAGTDEWAQQDEDVAPGPAPPSTARPRRRRRVLTVLGSFLAVVVIAAIIGFVRVTNDINPGGKMGQTVTVKVPNGASTPTIAHLLSKAGVLHGADVFELYVKVNNAGPLYPGTYRMATNERYSRVVAQLELGPPVLTRKLVVPEGFTVAQMAAAVGRLKALGITPAQFIAAARTGQVASPYLPGGEKNLEGLLFPATYPVHQGETADELVQYMAYTFQQDVTALGLGPKRTVTISTPYSSTKLHLTPYQVVIVASIVEREAKFDADRGPIASAIYNRLAKGMPLGAQSTLFYGLGEPKGTINEQTPNPYNTMTHHGLPPTPISSPGIPSLKAALDPPKTTYLYWVEVNPDGKMGYASTGVGFEHLQRECREVKLGC